MRQWLEKKVLLIQELDKKTLFQYISIALAMVIFISAFLLYRTQSSIDKLSDQLKKVGQLRRRTKKILEKNNAVEAQHQEVDEILGENPNFKIRRYFIDLLENKKLVAGTIDSSEVTNSIDSAYEDIIATATLTDITTKQLTELLQEIELNDRVHVKKLTILQKKPHYVDVSLTIATLLKRAKA